MTAPSPVTVTAAGGRRRTRRREAALSAKILATISDDATTPTRAKSVQTALAMPWNQLGAMLSFLVRRGHVERVRRGWYVRVTE